MYILELKYFYYIISYFLAKAKKIKLVYLMKIFNF